MQTRNSQDFNSYYDDYAYGGSIEPGTNLIPMNTLKGAIALPPRQAPRGGDIAPDNANPADAHQRTMAGEHRRHGSLLKMRSTPRAASIS